MMDRFDRFLSRFAVQTRTTAGFAILLLMMVGLAGFSLTQMLRIGSDFRILVELDEMDGAIGRTNDQLARLNIMVYSFMRTRDASDIATAETESKALTHAVEAVFTRFGQHPLLTSHQEEIRSSLDQHAKALNAAAMASLHHHRSANRFLAASVPIATTLYAMGINPVANRSAQIDQAGRKLQSSFASSRTAVTRYLVTLQPTDAETAYEEMNRFEATVNAQKATGDVRFDEFVAYIRSKLPAYRDEANSIPRAVAAETEAGTQINQATADLVRTLEQVKHASANLRTQTIAIQLTHLDTLHKTMLGVTGATFLFALLLAWLIGGSIARPIGRMTEAMRNLSSGRLDMEIPALDHHDEIGRMAAATEVFKRNALALQESEQRFRDFTDTSADWAWEVDGSWRYTFVSDRVNDLLGYAADELLSKTPFDFMPPENAERFRQHVETAVSTRSSIHDFENINLHKDGSQRHVLTSAVPLLDQSGALLGFRGTDKDITDRRRTEEQLQLAASVFTHAREGIVIMSPEATILEVNDAFTKITGYSRDEALGRAHWLLGSNERDKELLNAIRRDLIGKGHWYGDLWNRRKNGEAYAQMLTINAVYDAQGAVKNYLALFSDITTLKTQQKQLEHIAHFDALTSLPNRVLLADRLHQAMAQSQRRGTSLAVVYLDLDSFKSVNDDYGHATGDQVLMALSDQMSQVLREGDTLARLGGDEFVAVLLDLTEAEASVPLLKRLLTAAAQPVPIDDSTHQVSASLGVTFYPQEEEVDADQLLRQADQAMYQAKIAGKNRFHIFDAEQDRNVRGRHESLEHIRLALTNHEFVLHYQPKVNMRTGQVIGAEALIRWQHPESGLLTPGAFLPVIEDHPLGIDLGEWVIHEALTQLEIWQEDGLSLPVSINIGARQLQHTDFVRRVREILAAHPKVGRGQLMMEVLETSALEDLDHISSVIDACRAMGVNFALDDFGTGYSSLTYLKRLPVSMLKIDQSFVRDMLEDPDDLAILQGILGLATAFDRQIIAEGVETVAQGKMLLKLGCELAQGYGIARPMPAPELPAWAKTWRPDAAWSN